MEVEESTSSAPYIVGQVTFRLLCHVDTAGGVIGNHGTIVKNLESNTGATITFSRTIPNCHERVISISGEAAAAKRMILDEGCECDVSPAQYALVRVLERVLEVEGGWGGKVGCRLLTHVSQVGVVLGKGGAIVSSIGKQSGAFINILPQEQLPPCANHTDKVIQLMGKPLSVKKALFFVSSRLQDRSPVEILPVKTSCHGDTKFVYPRRRLAAPLQGHSESTYRNHTMEKDNFCIKVVFRLLCSCDIVGGVIGRGGSLIKALESETGASIEISASVSGSSERLATISAFEEPEPLYSAAQIALIRVFTRCVEVGIEAGMIPGLGKRKITTRLLVASDQIDWLIYDVGNVASDISAVSSVEIQLLAGGLIPNCAAKNDNVVQIIGSYENVKSALYQLTSRIRKNLFSSVVSEGIGKTRTAGFEQLSGPPFDQDTLTEKMDHLEINLRKPRASPSPWLQSLQTTDGDVTNYGGGCENESVGPDAQTKTTVEVVVTEQAFISIYGENGSNLNCVREISGATVELQEPCPGKYDGKVIIAGMPEQIQVAQSILQAFILSAS